MIIKIESPNDNQTYKTIIETDHLVTITKVFNGFRVISEDSEVLCISQRDSGFELSYICGNMVHQLALNNGVITVK